MRSLCKKLRRLFGVDFVQHLCSSGSEESPMAHPSHIQSASTAADAVPHVATITGKWVSSNMALRYLILMGMLPVWTKQLEIRNGMRLLLKRLPPSFIMTAFSSNKLVTNHHKIFNRPISRWSTMFSLAANIKPTLLFKSIELIFKVFLPV